MTKVAGLRNVLFDRISIEMVYRSLYYYLKAYARGDADELPGWLATCDKVYGVVKRKPKKKRCLPILALDNRRFCLTCD